MFNINLRSRSEELNYVHDCSQYVQYQPTFKICGTNLYTSAYPQYIHSQHTFGIWCTKVFTRIALFIFNLSIRSGSDVLNYLLGLPSIFNINLRSRFELLNCIHLLTISIFNINQRSRSEEQNYLHGCH